MNTTPFLDAGTLATVADLEALRRDAEMPPDQPWSALRYLAARLEQAHRNEAAATLGELPWPWGLLATCSPPEHVALVRDLGLELALAWARRYFHDHRAKLPGLFAEALPDVLTALANGKPHTALEAYARPVGRLLPELASRRPGERLLRTLGRAALRRLADDLPANERERLAGAAPAIASLLTLPPLFSDDVPAQPIADWLDRRLFAAKGGPA